MSSLAIPSHFPLRRDPIIKIAPIFPSALFEQLIGYLADKLLQLQLATAAAAQISEGLDRNSS